MNCFLRIATYAANIIMIFVACTFIAESYGAETYIAMLLLAPPALSLWALYNGPDKEERRLTRELSKARMQKELDDLGKKAPKKK